MATNTQTGHTGTCGQQQLELVFLWGGWDLGWRHQACLYTSARLSRQSQGLWQKVSGRPASV